VFQDANGDITHWGVALQQENQAQGLSAEESRFHGSNLQSQQNCIDFQHPFVPQTLRPSNHGSSLFSLLVHAWKHQNPIHFNEYFFLKTFVVFIVKKV
jgi:hypothetical protein